MEPRKRRFLRPALERVETRSLLSSSAFAIAARGVSAPQLIAKVSAESGTATPTEPGPPLVPGQGTPSRREIARTTFRATFSGPLYSGPGRYSDQKRLLYLRGTGTSNMFLHGDYQLALVIPTDPAAPITGAAYLQDKNSSSGIVGLDLVADPTSLDHRGRPTRATFTADPNIYGGVFFSPTAQGSIKIKYRGSQASALFQGQLYASGLTNPNANSDLYSKGV